MNKGTPRLDVPTHAQYLPLRLVHLGVYSWGTVDDQDAREIRAKFWRDVQTAQKEHVRAVAVFDAMVVEGSSATMKGLLEPTANDRRIAFDRYVNALHAFSKFLKTQKQLLP